MASRRHGSFDGYHQPSDRSGRGRSQRELQDRAGFDTGTSGDGCAWLIVLAVTVLAALLGVAL